ncbi:23S rRNA (uracil(1939)-C(5))-methyltransferase RlmD [Cognaticolwellia beringensis]|uniref:23S rRNA (uracil(1939)-C(5))-methyltransferase RlmD n=1 Tax=Cognaticolwellia beringensis TaxID=1967665 RepID=A0A222G949_9GAMM|nr:23S rRNA (uracil(1939)-C(5))-methyltransferase RlmD [Cognaticolwellia beringensis]ASP48428.1 23S rRNA (uracil(1939)-C(5))-methyltransferase [Cognaticolwellia beringensis]
MANFFKASPKKTQVQQQLTVHVSHLDQQGCGVAFQGKKPIFIEGALPNETLEVKLYEQKSKFSKAKLLQIITASPNRAEVKCRHYFQCGGCNLQHMDYQSQLSYKQDKITKLFSRQALNEPMPWQNPIVSEPWHYRRKARIGVQYNKRGEPIVGFRQRESSHLTEIKSCPVLVEAFNNIFPELKDILAKVSGKNAIGHIEIIAANVNVVLVRQLVKLTAKDKQLWMNFASKNDWLVYFDDGKSVTPLMEDKTLSYTLTDTIKIEFSVDSFIQVNHLVNNKMVEQAQAWLMLNESDVVLDLFCGLGNFSLPMAQKVSTVVGIEGIASMVDKAQANAQKNGISNCQFYQADLNSDWQNELWAQQKYTKILLDPARAGAYQALTQLLTFKVSKILYVSCDPASLARDAKLLIDHGYKIEKIALMDMFSQTKHVETMVMFSL